MPHDNNSYYSTENIDKRQEQADMAAAATAKIKKAEGAQRGLDSTNKQAELAAKGANISETNFGDGKLGRVTEGNSVDANDIRARRQAALGGLDSAQGQALREQTLQNVDNNAQTNLRQLRGAQGASGVRGGAGVAQQAGVLNQAAKQRADLEQKLLLDNVNIKNQALNSFEGTVSGQEAANRKSEEFNLEQRGKESFGRLATTLGYDSMSEAERSRYLSGELSREDAEKSLQAAKESGGK